MWLVVVIPSLLALLLLRMEGPLVVVLFLVGVLYRGDVPTATKAALLISYLVGVGVWFGVGLRSVGGDGTILSDATIDAVLLISVALAASVGLTRWRAAARLLRTGDVALGVGLIALVGLMGLRRPEHMLRSGGFLLLNLVKNGQWGPTLVVLGVLVLLVVLVLRPLPFDRLLSAPLASYFPFVVAISYFRNPYRNGWGDSGSRMATHILFVAMLYVALRVGQALSAAEASAGRHPGSSEPPSPTAAWTVARPAVPSPERAP